MAAKGKYRLLLNLGSLGFGILLSLFDIAIGKDGLIDNLEKHQRYNFSVGNLVVKPEKGNIEELKIEDNENIILTLNIFADKQYDYDQNIYLAEGNVKAIINGGILRSNLLSYDKSTGILSAEGNISFSKGGQYFKGEEFKFNLLKKEGFIKDSYGILDINNVLNDLQIDSNSNDALVKDRSINKLNNKNRNTYNDGIEFSFGNIQLPQNKITRLNKSIGSINNWRFQSKLIKISENSWRSNRIIFTNDPFDPHQIAFEGIDVIAEEKDGKLIIISSETNLILESRSKIRLGKRIFGDKNKRKNKFDLIYDGKDRDGFLLRRRSDTTKINKNIKIDFQPQFLINRAILGNTNSYETNQSQDNKGINFSDLLGLNLKLNANYDRSNFFTVNDLSTLNTTRLFKGIRHSSVFRKYLKMPILDDSSFNIFTTYRSRAWNGTIGETEIKAAYGGFIEKTNYFKSGESKNNINLRFGTAKYEAEKLRKDEMISLWRTSIFSSLNSEYQILKINKKNINQNKSSALSPVSIDSELVLKTNINSAYFKYEDGSEQAFIKLTLGPEIRLGRLKRNFLDYTKLSVMPGIKIKAGNSPFKFDNAIDLKTLNIAFMQQIYGPLMVDIVSTLNIDNSSDNYGDYFDTKLGLLWHKRAYEFGIYYHPNNDAGGFYFRINGFDFDNSVKAVF